jgi:MoaA/NifB/PqqE/SkfB family radical SAM enzyme
MRLTSSGEYNFCRWKRSKVENKENNIKNISPADYFQLSMSSVRDDMINGKPIDECQWCYDMEKYKKISGRQKQLLKTGIVLENFEKTMLASPYLPQFQKSADDEKITVLPVDWQIDLGNYCNGACVFCTPRYSSKISSEFIKLGMIDEAPPKAWSQDPELVDKFIDTLNKTKNIKYLHFIGGETVITPAFKKILKELIKHGLSTASIGFTTNLTVWDEEVNELLSCFEQVNLGMSIEALHPVNDYARYPSKIDHVRKTLDRWVALGKNNNWLMQLRITPTWMTIEYLDTVFEYAIVNNIGVESCNFLSDPRFMRMNLLPTNLRQLAIDKLDIWIGQNKEYINPQVQVNTRNPNIVRETVMEDALSYLNYLREAEHQPELLPELVSYLKKIESSRNNSVLNYIPHYEEFLRSGGY